MFNETAGAVSSAAAAGASASGTVGIALGVTGVCLLGICTGGLYGMRIGAGLYKSLLSGVCLCVSGSAKTKVAATQANVEEVGKLEKRGGGVTCALFSGRLATIIHNICMLMCRLFAVA